MKRGSWSKISSVRETSDVKLNITPMMDIFIIILIFLLKVFSTQGQLVTPAKGLTLPTSTVGTPATEALSVRILNDRVLVENELVLDAEGYQQVLGNKKEITIAPLFEVLSRHAMEAKKSSDRFGSTFSGQITIQGDYDIPYHMLTRVMLTCSRAGFPAVKLLVYRNE